MVKEYFDIIVIIPLEEELIEFMSEFEGVEDRSTPTGFAYIVNAGTSVVRMLVAQQDEMGKTCAGRTTANLLDKYDCGIVVCLGIAGSLSSDMRLGDVCYSGTIIDVYDNSKAIDSVDTGTLDIELSPSQFPTRREITTAFNFIRTQPTLRPLYEAWLKQRAEIAREFVPHAVKGRNNEETRIEAPNTRNGSIVCGFVSKSETYNKKLYALDRKILAIETESGGVFEVARERNVESLTIRGISDYANPGKSELETKSNGSVRRLAASNAVSFLKLQLTNDRFLAELKMLASGRQNELQLVETTPALDKLSTILQEIGTGVDEKLRELSPEFRLQAKGYRLPLPRVRKLEPKGNVGQPTYSPARELRDAIQDRQMVLINLPRTYPDQSLAWVIADDLMTAEIGGKQAVPIVIDGASVRPPRFGFEHLAPRPIPSTETIQGMQLVLIVENLPLNSKSRLNYLIEQVKAFEDAKFIFITRGNVNLVLESEFSTSLSTDIFSLCEVSFVEIAHFIQKNFSMTGSASEVVALRLRDTFSRFNLSAHPTYFAGIPRETLSALLHANRRAELIQLAVDGFLTFLVAGDKADISLSRTTRSRFLRRLVVAMKVEKQTFDQAQVITFTKEFSAKYDFAIDPLAFLQAFIGQGILHFDDDKVRLSLPFIESYLLAVELADAPATALRYFDVDDANFDFATFDLYAEIGAADVVINKVLAKLEVSTAALRRTDGRIHILLTDEVSPEMIRHPSPLSGLQESLRKAAEDVQRGKDETKEKQRLLDMSDRVRDSAAKHRKLASDGEAALENEDTRRLSSAVLSWAIGTMLLGSGAEHLDGQTKRLLAGSLVQLGSLILDEWTRLQMTIDFRAIKSELTTDAAMESFNKGREGDHSLEETKTLIIALVDILEYVIVAQPFHQIIGQMCEQARHRVLAESVQHAKVAGAVELVLYGTWLTDIDSKRGQAALRSAIKDLPRAPFLRMTLASHCLMRVYWNHWQQAERLTLLDVAEAAIKPISVQFDKSRLKRLITSDNPDLGSATAQLETPPK